MGVGAFSPTVTPVVMASCTVVLDRPIDLGLTLGPLRRGAGDPTMRLNGDGVWRATRTADGPATVHIAARGAVVRARAWGPGAERAIAAVPGLVGADDHLDGFAARHPVLARLARDMPGLRITRSAAVFEALVPVVLEQKVVGLEARRSYRRMLRALGTPAPGPGAGVLLVPPPPETVARLPYHAFHPWGVERKRADTLRRCAALAGRLEETVGLCLADAHRRLNAVPGVGPWTAAEVAIVALGDADAVSVGDYHLPHQVAWALAGEPRADDARMLELLAPYAGHRGRVVRLITAAGLGPARRAPRMPLRSFSTQ
jgi:3-methyladenine DNA glycosylase/8-oxoguanine DNA glycosylase